MESPPKSDAAAAFIDGYHTPVVEQVAAAVAAHPVVVVGMGWNPHVARARKALTQAGVEHEYIELGNYSNRWRERLAVKLWSGWPTFPQVFVDGTLIGGASLTIAALERGEIGASAASSAPEASADDQDPRSAEPASS